MVVFPGLSQRYVGHRSFGRVLETDIFGDSLQGWGPETTQQLEANCDPSCRQHDFLKHFVFAT